MVATSVAYRFKPLGLLYIRVGEKAMLRGLGVRLAWIGKSWRLEVLGVCVAQVRA